MRSEGLEWHEACDYWCNECFALRYEKYLEGFERRLTKAPETEFLAYCLTAFVYAVREANKYARRRNEVKERNGFAIDGRDIGAVASVEVHKRLAMMDCQDCNAIASEERQAELQQLADLAETLKTLEAQASYIVWNHVALGFTYQQIADVLGMSATKCIQIHRGALSQLRRLNGL